MEFGIFDHLDRGREVPVADLYEDRLKMVERYEAAGIHCYHLAEHHATSLGMAPSPNAPAGYCSGRWSISCRSMIRFG